MKKEVFVINLRGEKEPFSFQKVYQSARNVGASKEVALKIAKEIEKEFLMGFLLLEFLIGFLNSY
jgi:hypothetical protein